MNDRDFRLSKNVRPVRYEIRIDADLEEWRFRGRERIELTIRNPTDTIVLHSIECGIPNAEAVLPPGDRVPAKLSFNETAETVTLRFGQRLPAGTVHLELDFDGEIRERLRGFYRSQKDGLRYAATQFEAADARRAFPCFDEPAFKARFALTLVVPANAVAIANGAVVEERPLPKGRKEVRFAETPPISSYLVAYTVGPYDATPTVKTATDIPTRVFLPRGMAGKGLYARNAHARSLEYLEGYTDIPYPYGKVDAIGIPDFEAGAMENPGAITYRLTAIAAEEERASTQALKGIFYTAAHELTHMWWGDLVTMEWWDDLWLNESFATFIGYRVVADLVPEWGMWRDFTATLARPFGLDALVSTHPISFEVKNAKQATERFDVITYWKGAGVVRMLEGFLGSDVFQKGVRTYLNLYRESNATADDFWRELGKASGRDVAMIANAWIRQPGHPLVLLDVRPGDEATVVTLRQERFYADPEAASRAEEKPLWPVPMVITCGTKDGPQKHAVLFSKAEEEIRIPACDWIFPNGAAAGFYRFALDDAALARLATASLKHLEPQERLFLVDNEWALVKAGKVSLHRFFTVLQGLHGERDRAVLSAVTNRLSWMDTHPLRDTARDAFKRFVTELYLPQLEELGWDPQPEESTDDRLRRATVISALGRLARLQSVLEESRTRIERYLEDPASLEPNLVSVLVEVAAQTGDENLYERFLERKRASAQDPEEEQRFLFGLTAFESESLIRRTLETVETEEVREQDRAHVLARMLGMKASRAAAWEFVRTRWNELIGQMDPMLQQNLVRALAQLTPESLVGEVMEFLPPRTTEETKETAAQAMEQLTIDSAACVRIAPALTRILLETTGGA